MKVIRVLFTIVLALLLFPTIWFSLQGTVAYLTLYDSAFVQEIGHESNLSSQLIDSTIDYTTRALEHSDLDLPITLDEGALLDSILEHIDRFALSQMIDEFSQGTHHFLFGSRETLPVIDACYLQDLVDLGLSLAKAQVLESLTSADSGLNTDQLDVDALDTMVAQQLPTIELPKSLDLNQVTSALYGDPINPITSLRLITYQLPQNIVWILGILLIGIPLIYLLIHRFRLVATLQFFALTGLIASFFSFIGSVLLYWFIPNGSHQLTNFIGSDLPLVDSSIEFIDLLTSHILAKAITINLIALIAFLVILVLTEIKKKLYPNEMAMDTSKEALLQVLGSLAIGFMVGFFIRYQIQLASKTIDEYQMILTAFEGHNFDIDLKTLVETMKP